MHPASEIETLVAKFVDEMTVLAKREALEQVAVAFGVSTSNTPAGAPTSRGDKRSPAQLAELKHLILDHVTSHPGLRTEQLNAGLGTSTKVWPTSTRSLRCRSASSSLQAHSRPRANGAAPSTTSSPSRRRGVS